MEFEDSPGWPAEGADQQKPRGQTEKNQSSTTLKVLTPEGCGCRTGYYYTGRVSFLLTDTYMPEIYPKHEIVFFSEPNLYNVKH